MSGPPLVKVFDSFRSCLLIILRLFQFVVIFGMLLDLSIKMYICMIIDLLFNVKWGGGVNPIFYLISLNPISCVIKLVRLVPSFFLGYIIFIIDVLLLSVHLCRIHVTVKSNIGCWSCLSSSTHNGYCLIHK